MRPGVLSLVLGVACVSGYAPDFADGSGWLVTCHKYTNVFGIIACFSQIAWEESPAKCAHIANVMAQLIDNDEDGQVDDPTVVNELRRQGAVLWAPATEDEASLPPLSARTQLSGLWEAHINSCMVPQFRGASQTDRSTWAATRTVTSPCSNERDATFEEMLHLLTESASIVYPNIWGQSAASTAGAAVLATNGNCGWGHSDTFRDPGTDECQGQYAYNDETCDERCIIVEGIYWAVASYTGGLYTSTLAEFAQHEWLMTTPDDSMTLQPEGVSNARTLQSGSPALYTLVSDTTSNGHAWLPAVVPTGVYSRQVADGTTIPPAPASYMLIVGGIAGVAVALCLCLCCCIICCVRSCRSKKPKTAQMSGVETDSHPVASSYQPDHVQPRP